MRTNVFYTLFLLLILISNVSSFGRRKVCKSRKPIENPCKTVLYDPMRDENATMVDYHSNCGPAAFGVVQKIPYLRTCSSCDSIEINFSSACVRCGMCLAIADKINQTLWEIHDMMPPVSWLNETEIPLLLRTICNHSFEHHSLREVDGKRMISDWMPGSNLITTSADGLWGEKLKDLCHYYLDECGELRLYQQWQQWFKQETFQQLSRILCRSTGILRDCRSMEDMVHPDTPFKVHSAKVKITANYGGRE